MILMRMRGAVEMGATDMSLMDMEWLVEMEGKKVVMMEKKR
jgi:hypothetical protein